MNEKRIIHLLSRTRDRIQRLFQTKIDSLNLGNIAPAHGSVFFALATGPLSMQELARLIERDNSTVTALAKKLESLGYVRRVVSTHDTRSNIISLTEKGKKAGPKIIASSHEIVARIFQDFTPTERDTIMRLLLRIYNNVEA